MVLHIWATTTDFLCYHLFNFDRKSLLKTLQNINIIFFQLCTEIEIPIWIWGSIHILNRIFQYNKCLIFHFNLLLALHLIMIHKIKSNIQLICNINSQDTILQCQVWVRKIFKLINGGIQICKAKFQLFIHPKLKVISSKLQ